MNTQERIERFKQLWKENTGWAEEAVGILAEEIPDDEFQPIHIESIEEGETRWMIPTMDVMEIDQGVYVAVCWERGKTENQENIYDDDTVYLVKPIEKVVSTIEWKTTGNA